MILLIVAMKALKSRGLRLVERLRFTTTGWST